MTVKNINNKEIVDDQQFHNKLESLANTKPGLFSGYLCINHKGELDLTNVLQALIEKVKGLVGFQNRTNSAALQAKTIEFLEKGKSSIITIEDEELAEKLAARAGKTAIEIFKMISPDKEKSYDKFFSSHAKELERHHIAKFWNNVDVETEPSVEQNPEEEVSLNDEQDNAMTASDQPAEQHQNGEILPNDPVLKTELPAFQEIPLWEIPPQSLNEEGHTASSGSVVPEAKTEETGFRRSSL